MNFNEESARKIINYLLEEDIDDFSRWLIFIEEFNSEQIENLLNGNRNFVYPIKNLDIFINLVRKFDNFSELTLKWYQKEENYKYLKQLWLQYICIEDIRILLKTDKNGEKLTNYLESKNIKFSEWPNEIKEEFKKCAKRTIGSTIHEEDIKKKFNEQHSLFNNVFKAITGLKDYFSDLFKDINKKVEENFKKNNNSVIPTLVGSAFGMVASQIISQAKYSIDYRKFESLLVKQITEYDINICDAKKIAGDIIQRNICSSDGIIYWKAGPGTGIIDYDWMYNDTVSKNFDFDDKYMELNLNGKENETLSLSEKVTSIFQNNLVCGLITLVSLGNLGFSAYKYYQISKLTKTIAGKKYKENLQKIKLKFEQHINELDLTGDCDHYLAKINYVKANVESDMKELEQLIINIASDIKLFEKEKRDSIKSLAVSVIFGAFSAIGTCVATGGISTGAYVVSLLSNIISGTTNTINITECSKNIKELKSIQEDAEEEEKIMKAKLEELNLKGKQKNLYFPDYYSEFEQIIQKQKKHAANYILNKNYF